MTSPRSVLPSIPRSATHLITAAVLAPLSFTAGLPAADAAPAAAARDTCPDVEIVYARGTAEEPGVGAVGQEFVDALRTKLASKSVTVYPVNYPASDVWATGIDGVRDASAHIESTVANCPDTQVVLGGWSQGAAVAAFTTASAVPDVLPEGVDPATVPQPMPPEVADRVAALVLFAKPNQRAMNFLHQPPIVIGSAYEPKTVEYCIEGDVICSEGLDMSIHAPHNYHEQAEQGAVYAASRLGVEPVVSDTGSSRDTDNSDDTDGPRDTGSSRQAIPVVSET